MTAACAGHPSPDWWFSVIAQESNAAVAICGTCPIRQQCGDDAKARGELFGRWGWYTAMAHFVAAEDPDDFLLIGWPEPAPVEVEHSRSAYNAKAHGDCPDCARRNAEWIAQWRARGPVSQVAEAGHEQLDLFGRTA